MISIRDQLETSFVIENRELIDRAFGEVLVAGMGGSGVLGELLKALLPATRITIHHSYGLPPVVPPDSLVLIVSYSGTTEETISSYNEAVRRGLKTTVIAGGGELLEQARKDGVSYVKIPYKKDVPARLAIGYVLAAALEVLGRPKFTADLTDDWKATARDLARRIANAVLLVYTPPDLAGLGLFWKEAVNESAKLPAFSNTIPEMTHNEIESLDALKEKYILLIRDPRGEKNVWERTQAFVELAAERGWPTSEINFSSPERISDFMHTLILALETSVELARARGIDPYKTPLIEEVKARASGGTGRRTSFRS